MPCSGISSLISLSALAAIMAFLINGQFWKRTVLFLSAFPIAIMANSLRVGSMLIVATKLGSEVAIDFFHGLSGVLLFLVAVSLLLIVVRLLQCKFRKLRELAGELL
jgi:exosortase/archaeosortase family protein